MNPFQISGRQMSEAFRTTVFLTLSGGFQDAYTYMGRGRVFANAQTGNIVLMATNLCAGSFGTALRYLLPLLAFAAGVYFAESLRCRCRQMHRLHWRQLILLIEMLLLFAVGFIPNALDLPANMLVSFVCAMQVQSFRKVRGNAYASTMCIGNLRSGVQSWYTWRHSGDPAVLRRAIQYFAVIGLFAVGAAAGGLLTVRYGIRAIWLCCALLAVSFGLMFARTQDEA